MRHPGRILGQARRQRVPGWLVRVLAALLAAGGAATSAVVTAHAIGITEFSAGITSPGGQLTYGPDGNTWFTEPGSPNRIAKITPTGVVTEYTTGLSGPNAGLGGIAAGPDGNVWFTEASTFKIGRITPTGTITEFYLGTVGFPEGITSGPDGTLWYTVDGNGSPNGDEIGHITTSGTAGTFTTGLTAGSTPRAITTGPDGNLWFTEGVGGRVGRITTGGTITEFADSLSSQGVQGIAAGGDGNLWVAEAATNQVARVTTAGAATQFSTGITAAGHPTEITTGPDRAVWFTEPGANRVARITPSGGVTEYFAGISASAAPAGMATGGDMDIWFSEGGGARLGRLLPAGRGVDVSQYNLTVDWSQVANAGYQFAYARAGDALYVDPSFPTNWSGIAAAGLTRGAYLTFEPGTDPTAQATKLINAVGGLTPQDLVPAFDLSTNNGQSPSTVATEIQSASDTVKAAIGVAPVIYTAKGLWASYTGDYAGLTANPLWIAGYVHTPLVPASNWGGNGWRMWQYTSSGTVPGISPATDLDQASWAGLPLVGGGPTSQAVTSTSQYTLADSNGTDWTEIDPVKLRITRIPTVSQSVLLTANADLFTANAGFNQDLGIFVNVDSAPPVSDQLLAWKESGGFAGTFSPNAAYVQWLFPMTNGHTYLFKLKWKTNKSAFGATIYAGAGGPAPYSPTTLVAETFPAGGAPHFVSSTIQYLLHNSDGTTWQPIDDARLSTTLAPTANSTAVLGANVDLFTANAGYNQDIGIFVSVDSTSDALVAWKESGGFAGTFSPNAAFVKATFPMTGGHAYAFKLKWKANKNAPGATIYAAAGAGPAFSRTSLLAQVIPGGINPYLRASAGQYTQSNSDGASWQAVDHSLDITVSPAADTLSIVGANADLFTASAGYNQDIGIFVSDSGGPESLVAWKESGGYAGVFSPNAAFAQAGFPMLSGHTYVFTLKWKTNRNAPGAVIFAGAGSGAPFSPTRLTVELTG